MKIAVIGGSGFIGSRLINKLVELNIGEVLNIDNRPNPSCKTFICDITTDKDFLDIYLHGYDYVYLLAAVSEASVNTLHPVESMDINLMGTVNVLESCRFNKVKKVIFASTVWVYDMCEGDNVDENTPISQTKKTNLYTTSKMCGESLIRSYNSTFGLNYTILRFGTAYGPNCNPRTAISSFVRHADNGFAVTINGNGEGFRSFMHVSDHVKALVLSITNEESTNETINVDGPDKVTLNDIVELLKEYYPNLTSSYVESNLPQYTGKNVDCSKAFKKLGFIPTVNFKEGLKEYVQWFKNTDNCPTSG